MNGFRRIALLARRSALPVLVPLAAMALPGCAPGRTHQAATPAELADEVRVIAAVARSQRSTGRPICVARLIGASPSLDSLPTTDLAQLDGRTDEVAERTRRGSVTRRMLDDGVISRAAADASLGGSCSGSTFLSFRRVQFLGDIAIAFVGSRDSCGRAFAVFRLQRVGRAWQLRQTRLLSQAGNFSCDGPVTVERAGFFTIGNDLRDER